MDKREKVISDLEYLISEDCTDTQFDYVDSIQDAIAMLKEDEQFIKKMSKLNEDLERIVAKLHEMEGR